MQLRMCAPLMSSVTAEHHVCITGFVQVYTCVLHPACGLRGCDCCGTRPRPGIVIGLCSRR